MTKLEDASFINHLQKGQVLFVVNDENGERIQMLKIAPEGFFVRGSEVSVAPENEAREVYDAFKLFLTCGHTEETLLLTRIAELEAELREWRTGAFYNNTGIDMITHTEEEAEGRMMKKENK